ncbi:phytanoyl-CoA dioxygenase domain-containing protein 1-like [Lingula anatina]|uniref:Phytanoyl-CoA dioxygenase domain-containing protein 1-like n=1 Tax=Lingula anatina TaxID=7574 RepID=A0A1S3HRH9_LINAN|nr:phytanoyl-CoA dioxygenase domain-containing protein 1-like [Lingula anatina]|eukprot:XP_013388645.1 phytanoyl-CoA dioxygenase domain-containing protein 1-like [Lingula anatina]
MASPEKVAQFWDEGYTIIENFLSEEECDALKAECHDVIDKMDPKEHHAVFSCTGHEQLKEDYFLTSGDKVRFFFEKGAFDEKGELVVDKQKSLNKMGHALHALCPTFRKVTFSEKMREVVKNIGYEDPVICQSMYIFKNPGIGGVVTAHQDSWFLNTKPLKLMGVWIALEDATLENGCLWFIPGSHKEGITDNYRMIRNPDKDGPPLKFTGAEPKYDDSKFIPGPVKKGTAVLIHGEVVHKSNPNNSDKSREIYTFHIYDQKGTEYSSINWLQPTEEMPFPHLYTFS